MASHADGNGQFIGFNDHPTHKEAKWLLTVTKRHKLTALPEILMAVVPLRQTLIDP
ncbi:CoA transferase [Yersinia frederiksenii ATCC 33641]|nr:CoA transferase [Yersinia frederiksenii ATCC 33641]